MSPKDGGGAKSIRGAIAGAVAGTIESILLYPFGNMQSQSKKEARNHHNHMTSMQCIRQTIRRHGFKGLYRGWSLVFLGMLPKVTSRFAAYEYFCYKLQDEDGTMSLVNSCLAGMLAGITEAIVAITPVERIKVKLLYDMRKKDPQYKGLMHGIRKIIKQEGIPGIYRGLTLTVLRQGSNQAVRFLMMCTQKDLYTGSDHKISVPTPLVGLFGVIAGAASVVGNISVDQLNKNMKEGKCSNVIDCAKVTMYGGPKLLFKGSLNQMAHACLDVAVTFMIYESVMGLLENYWS